MPANRLSSSLLVPLLFVFLWSTGFIGAKYGLPYAEPVTFLLIRMIIAATLIYALIVVTRTDWPVELMTYIHVSIVGILIHGVYLGGVFFAISRGLDAGISALIVSLQPLATVILAVAFLNESLDLRKMTGIAFGLIGVLTVVLSSGISTGNLVPVGLLFCVFSLIGISVGTIYQKKYCSNVSLLPAVFIQYIANAIFLLPVAVRFETMVIDWSIHFIFALAWLVLVLSLGAVVLLMWLIRRGDASQVASLFYLVPPFAAIEAWLLFDEQLTVTGILGIALCVFGVALVIRTKTA